MIHGSYYCMKNTLNGCTPPTLLVVALHTYVECPQAPDVTPSSHIYRSNRPTEVNMWWEVTMIWFNLLTLRRWNRQKHTIQIFYISNRTPRNHPNLSANQPLSPTKFLSHLTPRHSIGMVILTSRRLLTLPQHGYASIQGALCPVLFRHHPDLSHFFRPKPHITAQN